MRAVLAIVLFCGLVALAVAKTPESEYQDAFHTFMKTHKKVYSSHEFPLRYGAFKYNYDYINRWNAEGSSTVLGATVFADLTNDEYRKLYLGTKVDARGRNFVDEEFQDTADTLNWADKGAVTPIKNQGQCGSCWSFSTTGSVEGAHQISTGKLVSLSEQNLVDCSTSYGNQGCNGGLMDSAFQYIIANKGIDTEASYPYTAKGGSCHFSKNDIGATISSFKDIARGSENALLTAVSKVGPVSVAIDASHNSFQLYSSGIYNEKSCSTTQLDHGVLVVGYGTGYWVVKNSWGTTWGLQGYIHMTRDGSNQCGIATQASYPIV